MNTSLKKTALVGITTKNNDPALAKGYRLLNILSDNRSRYGNIFLIGKIKKDHHQRKDNSSYHRASVLRVACMDAQEGDRY
jgi:hypothetical protein